MLREIASPVRDEAGVRGAIARPRRLVRCEMPDPKAKIVTEQTPFLDDCSRPTEWDTDGVSRANRNRIVVENFSKLGLALFVFLIPEVSIRAESAPCQSVAYEHSEYTVCEVDLRRQSVRLFWKKPDGYPYEYLSSLPRVLGDNSRHLLFATNGGMYHPDNSPVGLYVARARLYLPVQEKVLCRAMGENLRSCRDR